MLTDALLAARALHFGACLLLFGWMAFDRLVARPAPSDARSSGRAYLILVPIILISGIAWFLLVAANMGEGSLDADTVRAVWSQTEFGKIWKARLVFWIFLTAFTLARLPLLRLFICGLLLGSLAWAGHAREAPAANWHLCADVLHLLVAGLWPTALVPLLLRLKKWQRNPSPADSSGVALVVRRFSILSIGSVFVLVWSGWASSYFLVGSWSNLFHKTYGQWLLFKIVLFVVAVALGAANLLRHKPRLINARTTPAELEKTLQQLRLNICAELILGAVIILIVGILGILPPAAH